MSGSTSQVPSSPLPPESGSSSGAADYSRPAAPVERRLRLWPGVVIVAVQWILITVPGWIAPATLTHFMTMFWGPILALVALMIWWLWASRIRWVNRWLGLLACAVSWGRLVGAGDMDHASN